MVPFSYESNTANIILERSAYKKHGGHIGTLVLCRRAKKAGLVHDLQQITRSEMELHDEIKKAYQRYDRLKRTIFDEIPGWTIGGHTGSSLQ